MPPLCWSKLAPLWGVGAGRDYSTELPQRDRLYLGLARVEHSRTELFAKAKGVAATMQERVFRTPGCAGETLAPCALCCHLAPCHRA